MFLASWAHFAQSRWTKQDPGFVKIITDDTFDPMLRGVAAGIIARDSSSIVLGGYSMPLICPYPASAEALAILEGLKFIVANGWTHVVFETDSVSIAKMVNNIINFFNL